MREVVYDKGLYHPLPENASQVVINPRLLIFHTNGGPSTSSPPQLYNWMLRADVKEECTFDIGSDGAVWQFMDLNKRADCNYLANMMATSVETQDRGYKTINVNNDPWTQRQCEAIVDLMVWWNWSTGIPLVRAVRWDGFGVGVHKDFAEWSAAGHSCPGLARAEQFDRLLREAAAAINQPIIGAVPNMLYVEDADTGKFWLIWIDAYGQRVACPLDETADPDWNEFAAVQAAIGPLAKVGHAALQRLYDKRGEPKMPEVGGLVAHKHDEGETGEAIAT